MTRACFYVLPSRAALAAAVVLAAPGVTAQTLLLGTSVEASSGVAAGGPASRVARARTALRIAVDGRNDEDPKLAYSGGLVAEVEPRAAFGLDAHVLRSVGPKMWAGLGAIGFLAPKTLLGVSAFGAYRRPFSKGMDLSVGPAFQVFVLGSDLPSTNPIWQLTLRVGVHVDL